MRVLVGLSFALAATLSFVESAHGNPVERACRAAGRAQSAELCSCIGAAASLTLGERDQALAADFFANPQAAQDIRMSDRRRDEAFWDRYLNFGQVAEDMCG
ncbi:MAG: hypothetical protein AAGA70_08260 [Pseudomonadota bacterium]